VKFAQLVVVVSTWLSSCPVSGISDMRGYFLRAFFGPSLSRMYNEAGTHPNGMEYLPSSAERYGSNIVTVINSMFSIGYYTSPFLMSYAYKRDMFNVGGLITLLEIFAGFTTLYTTSLFLRAVGRASNNKYQQFLDVLDDAQSDFTRANKARLSRYDFEFKAWPVEFQTGTVPSLDFIPHPEQERTNGLSYTLHRAVAYVMVHSFGISLVYPGSMSLLQAGIGEALTQGRTKLVLEKKGERFKLKTSDGNEIDAMFVDRRPFQALDPNGSVLVITCEGNAGFYEMGMTSTPIDAGYSVLGWNHPGFGGSTGTPLPDQEANAIDTVMQFAINKLGFSPDNILLHGWSIGGFTATWAASHYPDVKGVILDATFDDLLPLAIPRMPEFMETLVRIGIVNHVNLNVAEQLQKYKGPILLIRRRSDEMITTDERHDVSTNRGNFLLKKILRHRYPLLFTSSAVDKALDEFLANKESSQREILQRLGVTSTAEKLQALVREGAQTNSVGESLDSDPQRIGMVLFLASKYMVEFDSTHCTPLPVRLFVQPWDPTTASGATAASALVGGSVPQSSASSTNSEDLSMGDDSFVKL